MRCAKGFRPPSGSREDSSTANTRDQLAEALGWVGPELPEKVVRQEYALFLLRIKDEFLSSSGREDIVSQTAYITHEGRTALEALIRPFELGVDSQVSPPSEIVHNTVIASSINGGIQQAGGDAQQTNTVIITPAEIHAALDRLKAVWKEHGSAAVSNDVETDIATIEAQLKKEQPDTSTLQAAGRSLRNVIEGAAGGALAAPLAHAMEALSLALGII